MTHSLNCDWICSYIEENDIDKKTLRLIRAFTELMDPTYSEHGAHIRDTARNNGIHWN